MVYKTEPYRILGMTLILQSGKRVPVDIVEKKVIRKPLKLVKEQVLDAFSQMKDAPVNVDFRIKPFGIPATSGFKLSARSARKAGQMSKKGAAYV